MFVSFLFVCMLDGSGKCFLFDRFIRLRMSFKIEIYSIFPCICISRFHLIVNYSGKSRIMFPWTFCSQKSSKDKLSTLHFPGRSSAPLKFWWFLATETSWKHNTKPSRIAHNKIKATDTYTEKDRINSNLKSILSLMNRSNRKHLPDHSSMHTNRK